MKLKRRFSRGDGVEHPVHGFGIVSQGSWFDPKAACWVCWVNFASDTSYALRHQDIHESELKSRPGLGEVKYGQGAGGCRVGSSRYGDRSAERQNAGNGRTVVRRLTRHHKGRKAR